MEIFISVVALVISVVSGAFSFYTFVWTARRDRKQATLDAYNQLQEQAFDYLNHFRHSDIADIAQNPRSEAYKELGGYIARIEHFCVGVNQKIYDRNIVYELGHGYFDGGVRHRIEPIIERKNSLGIDFYENIHKLYKWMDEETERRKRN
ncbi:MAG: hypothetical protein IKU13_06845 [Clostridia bacterium]|nr:hypothetical protein [Clostridia bacterium]MBR5265797.1 hypothetical protein [Clostridia bacterium]